jgi:hypothetical protein
MKQDIIAFSIHLGRVRTEIDEKHAPLSAEANAYGIYEFINSLAKKVLGSYLGF